MKLNKFLEINQISISKEYVELCMQGLEIMSRSKDVNHTEKHIYHILLELDTFIKYEKTVEVKDIDFEVLLTAICWHDTWKSTRKQTKSLVMLLFEQLYDGFGSFLMFRKYIKNKGLMLRKSRTISAAILFHPVYQFYPPIRMFKRVFFNRLEIVILEDIDNLAGIQSGYIDYIAKKYIKKGETDPLLFRIAYFWVKRYILTKDDGYFNFPYTKKRFKKLNRIAISKMIVIFNELMKNKKYYFDPKNPKYKYIENFQLGPRERELVERLS